MADAEDAIIGEITHSDPDSDTQDNVKQQGFIGKSTPGTKEGKTPDLLSEALSKMDESGQEDEINFSAAAGETDANTDGAAASGLLELEEDDHDDKQVSETVIPEAEPGDGFPVVGDQNQMLIADSTSSNDNGLIDGSIESQADCLTGQIDSESSKIDTESSALSGDHDSAMSSSSNNVLSDIAASSLLGSIATMIDSGSDCSLTENSKNKDALNILETASASAVGTTPTSVVAAPAANPISLNLARSAQNTSLLVNGNSLLTGSASSNIGLGTSLLNTPGLIQAISQQQTAPITSVPTLRVAPSTPSPVTITVRTPPGTGALSQTLISNIVNTPEVQALLAKNPGQPITIVRVPDAPATVTTQSSKPTPAPAPLPASSSTPAKAPALIKVPVSTTAPVSAPILSTSQKQGSTIPMMKVVTNATNKQQTPVRTFPPGTILSNRLPSNSTPTTTKTTFSPTSTSVKSSPSPKPAIVLGVKKKVGRGGGKAAAKGMAPAVPSSQDLHLMRQKRPANCKTRSGRVSRPPLYRIKEYKTMSNEEMGDQPGSSDGEYSDYDDGENATSTLSFYDQKRRYKCQNCEKRYIGRGGLARHYRDNQTHGDPDAVFAKTEDEDPQMEMETDEKQSDKETKEETPNEAAETPSEAAETNEAAESPSEAAEKPNGNQSPSPKPEDDKPSSSEETSQENKQAEPEPERPKPAIITYHYPYKPRGRGRGRPPGSGRKVVDQSGDASVITSNSKDVPKAEASTSKFFDPKTPLDDDLIKVTLPMLSKVITPWEYIVARAQQTTTKDAIFPTILKSLKEMHLEARKMAASCLERVPVFPVKDHSVKGNASQEILIEDDAMAKVLGVETGRYRFKDPSDDALPKTVRLLKKQEALSKDKEQKQPKAAKSVGEALQRKRRMASSPKNEPPSKKTPGTISILSPRSSYSRLTTPSSFPAKRVHTIGTIASIADVPNANATAKPAAEKRPIPPLGPISSASKGLESNTKAFESSPTAKTTSVTTALPPLKPIRTKPTNTQSTSSQESNTTTSSATATTTTTTPSSEQSITAIEDDTAKESSSISSDSKLLTSTQDSTDNNPAKAQEAETSNESGPPLMETGDTPSEDLVEQTTVLPEGTTIMQLEDGTFLLQKPDGTAMQIQTPEGMTIETVQALLSMEGGAIETVEEPSPQYILDDGSCVQLPAGMSLDMAVEMGLINQSAD
nr:mucin-5AC-like isoform X2 [Lytechinus pictus]